MSQKTKVILVFVMSLFLFAGAKTNATLLSGKFANKLFYTKFKTVYMSDMKGKNIKKLFSVKDYTPESLQVIDKNALGYYNYEGKWKNPYTGIYKYNLTKKKKVLVKKTQGWVRQIDWYDKNTYTYLVSLENEANAVWSLHLVAKGKDKKIKEWKGQIGGRGGYYKDNDNLKFSSDGKYIFHISTSSPRSFSDYNIYVFNRKKQIAVIKNATHPEWILNNKIVHVCGKNLDHLCKYNLKTKKSARIKKAPKNSFNPKFIKERREIAFWSGLQTNNTYTYNFASNKLKKIKKDAVPITWLGKDKLLVYKTKTTTEQYILFPETTAIGVLNLKNHKLSVITQDTNRQYFSEYK